MRDLITLEPGQTLPVGKAAIVAGEGVRQFAGHHRFFALDSRSWISREIPGTFVMPAPMVNEVGPFYVFTKDLAEAWAYIEKANRERPVRHERVYRDTYSHRSGFTFNNQSGEYEDVGRRPRRME